MLFNSFPFIFLFLPVVLGGFYALLTSNRERLASAWLCLASLFFYGWWNPFYLVLLCGSILYNFGFSRLITEFRENSPAKVKLTLTIGIVCNVLLLCYFKYTDFLIDFTNDVFKTNIPFAGIVLPLAISFFTFQKIAYLVDCYRGLAKEHDFLNLLVFVTFFPQLIAGPIVHYREMMPQYKALPLAPVNKTLIAMGVTLFSIGLFKKAVLADLVAVPANAVYDAAQSLTHLSAIDAWGGAVAYSYQIYFDFSGYSDMAIGLALMFGITLPVNFLSPYKATGFIDFWRRWHITLSRFLRDYIYIPLGGNRAGTARQTINIGFTMLIGGLWHGASWTFVLWGGLHGLMIAANHALIKIFPTAQIPKAVKILCTFLLITILWVFFRAENLEGTANMLHAMAAGGVGHEFLNARNILLLAFATILIFFAPSSMQLMGLGELNEKPTLEFSPNLGWLILTVGCLLIGCLLIQTNIGKEFIYFDF